MKKLAEALLQMYESPGYMILLRQFKKDAEQAMLELVDVDPTDLSAIIALQSRAKRFTDYLETPRELIEQGFQSEEHEEIEAGQDAEIDMVDDQD